MHSKWSSWKRFYNLGYVAAGTLLAGSGTYTFYTVHAKSASVNDNKPTSLDIITDKTLKTDSELKIKINRNNVVSINNSNCCDETKFKRLLLQPDEYELKLKNTISKARDLCHRVKDELGLPGVVVGVSVNGQSTWEEGIGYSDLENRVEMKPETVLRIASISKSLTMAMMAKLIEEKKIDIDKPIHTYLKDYPKDGEKNLITTRHLLSHLSGIRHYAKKGEKEEPEELESAEYFIKDKYETLDKAMTLFKNDELHFKPGTKFLYSSHGWTVVSAVIEKITETPFEKHAQNMFKFWGMKNTHLDQNDPIIYNRARPYTLDKKSLSIRNSPYVDNSYKWAGGGFLSDVGDLMRFAHIMLASLQNTSDGKGVSTTPNGNEDPIPFTNNPFLKTETVLQLWTGNPLTKKPNIDYMYGLGFVVGKSMKACMFCKEREFMHVEHTGGAIGASSILHMAFPQDWRFGYDEPDQGKGKAIAIGTNNKPKAEGAGAVAPACPSVSGASTNQVKGVVVAMITNLTDANLSKTSRDISDLFKWMV